jgi:hypothetical protein
VSLPESSVRRIRSRFCDNPFTHVQSHFSAAGHAVLSIAIPQDYVKGNRMSFAGVTDKSDRDDLIVYLEQATKTRR